MFQNYSYPRSPVLFGLLLVMLVVGGVLMLTTTWPVWAIAVSVVVCGVVVLGISWMGRNKVKTGQRTEANKIHEVSIESKSLNSKQSLCYKHSAWALARALIWEEDKDADQFLPNNKSEEYKNLLKSEEYKNLLLRQQYADQNQSDIDAYNACLKRFEEKLKGIDHNQSDIEGDLEELESLYKQIPWIDQCWTCQPDFNRIAREILQMFGKSSTYDRIYDRFKIMASLAVPKPIQECLANDQAFLAKAWTKKKISEAKGEVDKIRLDHKWNKRKVIESNQLVTCQDSVTDFVGAIQKWKQQYGRYFSSQPAFNKVVPPIYIHKENIERGYTPCYSFFRCNDRDITEKQSYNSCLEWSSTVLLLPLCLKDATEFIAAFESTAPITSPQECASIQTVNSDCGSSASFFPS